MGQPVVALTEEGLTLVEAEALIYPTNGTLHRSGLVECEIMGVAGNLFDFQLTRHQLRKAPTHGITTAMVQYEYFVARRDLADGPRVTADKIAFQAMLYVCDPPIGPVSQFVSTALTIAEGCGFRTVSMPVVRGGVQEGKLERSREELISGIADGVAQYFAVAKGPLRRITVSTYSYGDDLAMLRRYLSIHATDGSFQVV